MCLVNVLALHPSYRMIGFHLRDEVQLTYRLIRVCPFHLIASS
jgi:hypothetical protein